MSSEIYSDALDNPLNYLHEKTKPSVLSGINNPDDLKNLNIDELNYLAYEIRKLITGTVFNNGGHLASNLGVVELSIALHYIFDFSKDYLVFDVSHQCYTHKILTGRAQNFNTLRQNKGISGYTNPDESCFDIFHSGHAGTAVSTCLGLAVAQNFIEAEHKRKVVAVVGDASISTGMSFEALNNANVKKSDILVILNDNEMSIENTVGSLALNFNRMRTSQTYKELKEEVVYMLEKIPKVGIKLEEKLRKIKEFIKHLLIDQHIFELLGFKYFGPVNGHDLNELIPVLDGLKNMSVPRILHVVTKKGYGHTEAVKNPSKFHGVSPVIIDPLDEELNKSGTTFTKAFGDKLVDIAKKNNKVIAITAAMPGGTGLSDFSKAFPHRFFDVGISEQHSVGFAAGLARQGFIPVVALYSTFLQRAFDQIFQEACLQNLKIIFALDRAGLVGQDGPSHHGIFDISYLRMFPNITLLAPVNMAELQEMLGFAVDNINGPVAIRYPRDYANSCIKTEPVKYGKSVLLKNGTDIAIIGYGAVLSSCFESLADMEKTGISLKIFNARFAKPVDPDMLKAIIDENLPVVTIEEHILAGGFGSAVLESFSSITNKLPSFLRIGISDKFINHGTRKELLSECRLDNTGIVSQIIKFYNEL